MKHGIILTVGIGAGAFFWLFALATGYFVNPVLFPFGVILQPFFVIVLAVITVLVPIGYCVWLLFVRKTRRNIGLTLAALAGPVLFAGGPRLLSGYDAFVYRMESFSEAEYLRLATEIKSGLDERGINRLRDCDVSTDKRPAICESLFGSHPILEVSEFPLSIGAGDETVSLFWGSGLFGGFRVMISLNSDPPSGWADSWRQAPYDVVLPVTYIYDGVALLPLP